MPTYCYRRVDNDEPVTLLMGVGEMLERQNEALAGTAVGEEVASPGEFIRLEDGTLARRDFRAELVRTRPPGNWPQVCTIDGVHPDQVPEAEAASVEAGVPTHFTKEGGPIFDSPRHRKAYYEKVSGQFDRNAGYSDPVPQRR